jgi:hypothetical protein
MSATETSTGYLMFNALVAIGPLFGVSRLIGKKRLARFEDWLSIRMSVSRADLLDRWSVLWPPAAYALVLIGLRVLLSIFIEAGAPTLLSSSGETYIFVFSMGAIVAVVVAYALSIRIIGRRGGCSTFAARRERLPPAAAGRKTSGP